MPGVFTPTEAFLAIRSGASALKFFPASVLGAKGIAAIGAVLPKDIVVGVVGGISEADFADYAKIGVRTFGLGSSLYKPGMSAAEVGDRAAAAVAAWDQVFAGGVKMANDGASIFSDVVCELGEGPSYDPASGKLFWFDIVGKKLLEKKFADGPTIVHDLPFMASAIATIDAGRQLIAAEDGIYIRDVRTGALTLHTPLEAGQSAYPRQ